MWCRLPTTAQFFLVLVAAVRHSSCRLASLCTIAMPSTGSVYMKLVQVHYMVQQMHNPLHTYFYCTVNNWCCSLQHKFVENLNKMCRLHGCWSWRVVFLCLQMASKTARAWMGKLFANTLIEDTVHLKDCHRICCTCCGTSYYLLICPGRLLVIWWLLSPLTLLSSV